MRVSVLMGAALAALALGGCSGQGPLTEMVTSNGLPPASPEQVAPYQGRYSGEADITDPGLPNQVCTPRIPFVGFQVQGNQVSFGQFYGVIRADMTVNMVARNIWIEGRFQDGGFAGGMRVPPEQVCTYRIWLTRGY
jgi:hypothetical protein